MRFEHFLKAGNLRLNTVTFYMRVLRAIYNKAVRAGYAPAQGSPFLAISFKEEKTRKLALRPEYLSRLAGWDFGRRTNLAEARDLFLFSFYTRGMSFVDMAYLKRTDITEGTIFYKRHKTGQPLSIRILPELQALIDRYRSDDPWVLPILRCAPGTEAEEENEQTLHRRYKAALIKYLFSLSGIARLLDIPQKLTFNAARHSWASLARVHGIPVGVISQSLGHASEKTTTIYLDALNPELIDRANEIVTRI